MNDPNSILDGSSAFPFVEVSKSMDGAEAMNRVTGKQETRGPGRTGRPRKSREADRIVKRIKALVDPDNPQATAIAFNEDDENLWLAGSILQIELLNDTSTFVLMQDTQVAPESEGARTEVQVDEDDASRWFAGSVLNIVWPNGETRAVTLESNTAVLPWDFEGGGD